MPWVCRLLINSAPVLPHFRLAHEWLREIAGGATSLLLTDGRVHDEPRFFVTPSIKRPAGGRVDDCMRNGVPGAYAGDT